MFARQPGSVSRQPLPLRTVGGQHPILLFCRIAIHRAEGSRAVWLCSPPPLWTGPSASTHQISRLARDGRLTAIAISSSLRAGTSRSKMTFDTGPYIWVSPNRQSTPYTQHCSRTELTTVLWVFEGRRVLYCQNLCTASCRPTQPRCAAVRRGHATTAEILRHL